jgi:hypothetical protein
MKIKTQDLIGPALDWAVGIAEQPDGAKVLWHLMTGGRWSPSQDWAQGGPIIEREGVNTFRYNKLVKSAPDVWCGHKVVPRPNMEGSTDMVALNFDAPTPLIAAMRCYVAMKLGDEIELPQELL